MVKVVLLLPKYIDLFKKEVNKINTLIFSTKFHYINTEHESR